MTTASLIVLAAEGEHHAGNVMLETFPFGVVALVVFGALALVTLSYRNVSNRHAHKAEAYTRAHGTPKPEGHGH